MSVFLSRELFWVFNFFCLGLIGYSSVGTNQNFSLILEKLYNTIFLKNRISKVLVIKHKVLDLGVLTFFVFPGLVDSNILICLGLFKVLQHSKDLRKAVILIFPYLEFCVPVF
jgi:hypothetical protein